MKKNSFAFSVWEKIVFVLLFSVFIVCGIGIFRIFYIENTKIIPKFGGEFAEGTVGIFPANFQINPVFSIQKPDSIESDVVSLVFAGLMRFDPETGKIVDHMATHTISPDKTVYEFTLKENIFWHDGEIVTADDIIFTFRDVVQNPNFKNKNLQKTFSEVLIEKIDEKTVRFSIPEKQKTFFTNFTLGILPRHLLVATPIENLDLDSFNQQPIGCGPFRFDGVFVGNNMTEIRVSAFEDFFLGLPKIEKISLRVFPDQKTLFENLKNLDGIRPVRSEIAENFSFDSQFEIREMVLPQYLAVFFRMKDDMLATKQIRQAMRAAIPKNELAEKFSGIRIDTPLVELWPQDSIINISKDRAGELLTEAGYFFPDESPENSQNQNSQQAEKQENSTTKFVFEPSSKKFFATLKSNFYISGKTPEETKIVEVNNYQLQKFSPEKKEFSYLADTKIGTLKKGENKFNIVFKNEQKKIIDTEEIIIFFEEDAKKLAEALENYKTPDFDNEKIDNRENLQNETANYQEENENKWRKNKNGKWIQLKLSFPNSPKYFQEMAEIMQKHWEEIGIEVVLESLDFSEISEKIINRDYEMMLIGQNLGYNLDAYPYFHLSQIETGLNLPDWQHLEASVLLEEIRRTHDPQVRYESLLKLRDIIVGEVPAMFLFSPKYQWIFHKKVKNVKVKKIALIPDRFFRIEEAFVLEKRELMSENLFFDFFNWFLEETKKIFSF